MTDPATGSTAAPGSRRLLASFGLAALILVGWVVLAWPWLSGRWTVPWDAKAHFQPQLEFLAAALHSGQSPFWNPYIFAGWPQIADPQSLIFVPAMLLLALVDGAPSFVAMDATVYGALLAGALALALYFRDRGWHPAAAAVAALAFAFGGSAAWRIQHTGQILSYAVVPIAMLLLARTLERRSIGYGIAAGLAGGVLALGRDQIALLGLYLLIGQTAMALLFGQGMPGRGPVRRIGGAVLPLGLGAVAGLAITVVPVAFTLILAQESNRPEITYEGAGMGSLHPASLITTVIADLFGQADPAVHYWGPPSAAFGVTNLFLAQNMGAFYAGAVPIVAILMLGIARGLLLEREIRFLAAAGLISVVYAIGWYTPAFRLFYDYVPGVRLYRRPADATFFIGFFVAVLGGYCVHRWLARDLRPARPLERAVQWSIALTVLVVLPIAFGLRADRLAEAGRPTLVAVAFVLGALVVLWLARAAARRSAAAAAVILAGFTIADLAWNNAPNESTAYPPAFYEALKPDSRDPVILELKRLTRETATGDRRDRVELAGLGFHWPNAGMVHGFDHTLGYNPLRFRDYEVATAAQDTIGLPDQRRFNAMFPSYSSTMARLLGLRWIATTVPLTTIDPRHDPARIVEVARWGETRLYENRDALPRVLFVDRVRTAETARLLRTGIWPDGFDPLREVVLEPGALPAASEPGVGEGAPGTARIVTYAHDTVTVEIEAARAGVLVLNDVWHRWWRADLDGAPVPMVRANGIFRAVVVPEGRHRITFRFHPFAGLAADLRARLGK